MTELSSPTLKRATPLADRVRGLLGVEAGEEAGVGSLVALYGVLIMGVAFVETIAFALFIGEFGPGAMPYSYIASAVLASLAALGFLRLSERFSFQTMLVVNIASVIVGCVLFWAAMISPAAHWAVFLLPTWFQIQINLVNLAVWPLAGRMFDVRQAKRLFGLVGAGNWLANIVGGFVAAPLVGLVGTNQMLLLAALATAAGLWLLRGIARAQLPPAEPPAAAPAAAGAAPKPPARADRPLRRYIWLIFAYTSLWWVAFVFLDNIFYDRAAAQFPDPAQLAQSIGLLLSAIGAVALVTTIFGTGFMLRRYGLQATFLAMPVVCGAAMLVLALAGSLGQVGAPLFWLACISKLINVAWGFSLAQSALVLSYQPLPDDRRGQVQTLAEGIVQPIAVGVGGLVLLGLNTLLGLSAAQIAWFFVAVMAALAVAIVVISRQYPQMLSAALARRQWGGAGVGPIDQAGLELLRQALNSPHPTAVLYSMEMLEQADPAALAGALPALLGHPAVEVRRAALARVERMRLRSAVSAVQEMLAAERAPEARASALQALAAIVGPQEFAPLVAALADSHPDVRRGALAGLLRYAGEEQQGRAAGELQRLAAAPDPADRILAAQVVGEVGGVRFLGVARALLGDAQAAVRREALKMAVRAREPELWPAVVAAGATPGTTRMAVWALAAGGEAALPAIAEALARPNLPRDQLVTLANSCRRIRGPRVAELLAGLAGHEDGEARTAILEALSAAGYRAAGPDVVRAQVRAEAAQAAWLAAAHVDIGDGAAAQLAARALEAALHRVRDRICLWLSFAYDAPAILRARATLAGGPVGQHAYALEILDTQLPADLKSLVLPIAEAPPPHELLARLQGAFPQDAQPAGARLRALIDGPQARWVSTWARACALFAAARLPAPACLEAARAAAATDPSPLVRETARTALARLDPTAPQGEPAMLSTIEKVIILKSVGVFGQTTDDVLADVAGLLEEVDIAADQAIFQKGDLGDSLYIIVTGKVRVHDGERLLNYLGERDVFGEMALLDTEPRVASVTAVEPTTALRLEQQPLYELITDRPEVAIGLIRVLTGRLRARVRDVTDLSAQVRSLMAASAQPNP